MDCDKRRGDGNKDRIKHVMQQFCLCGWAIILGTWFCAAEAAISQEVSVEIVSEWVFRGIYRSLLKP